MVIFFSLLSGLLFGAGLIISGMANPAKVSGFLDITRDWDPSLALVMAGAIAVGLLTFGLAARRKRPVFEAHFYLPASRTLDKRLITGAALFGFGWGLAGICPGPALVLLGGSVLKGVVFVIAMLVGMLVFGWLDGLTSLRGKSPNRSS
ncbi:YeeE/YedE family protein [Pantoea stewartii]|uniref:YeeE/YedE family protein n=1 Tax=Pantoea stewartii TaxID=66269 RepID=UPI002DB9148C|nr:YeeE/YedE family protein [Pantoea stewartii]MEB6537088.1 YeeE/YedE family protein [Pantoea stewartii]